MELHDITYYNADLFVMAVDFSVFWSHRSLNELLLLRALRGSVLPQSTIVPETENGRSEVIGDVG